jgi:hypothetical protein
MTDIIAKDNDEPAQPKLWKDMTREEKGALLLAHHEGKVIEYTSVPVTEEGWELATHPAWIPRHAYRVKPEPVRETVRYHVDDCGKTFNLTDGDWHATMSICFDKIDGVIQRASLRWEKL